MSPKRAARVSRAAAAIRSSGAWSGEAGAATFLVASAAVDALDGPEITPNARWAAARRDAVALAVAVAPPTLVGLLDVPAWATGCIGALWAFSCGALYIMDRVAERSEAATPASS
jgi:hypothetical protein